MYCLNQKTIYLCLITVSPFSLGAVSVDRTRVIYHETKSTVPLILTNHDRRNPYLIQTWVSDLDGNKIRSALFALPPLLRINPGEKAQIRITKSQNSIELPRDRESVFLLNIREIPVKVEELNTFSLAIQSRLKIFYRPDKMVDALINDNAYKNISLSINSNDYVITNDSPIHYTITGLVNGEHYQDNIHGLPLMVPPFSSGRFGVVNNHADHYGGLLVVDDFGEQVKINFTCKEETCQLYSDSQ